MTLDTALPHVGEALATIAGAGRYSVRSFPAGVPQRAARDEHESEWVQVARDAQLRDEILPTLSVRRGQRGVAYMVFGRFEGPLAIVRLEAADGVFRPAQLARTRRFLSEHGASFTHRVIDDISPALRRVPPVTFVVDETLRTILSEDVGGEEAPLHALYRPRDGVVSPLLADPLAEMIDDLARGRDASLTRALPLAMLRVARMVGSSAPYYLVTVEPARRRATMVRAMSDYGLSRRETQVLGEVLRGASSSEIGETLSIASSTATFHLKRLLRKTNSRNRTELAARVLAYEEAGA
ncbi:MAG TPA: helix-turn-helix transcriptional regulator [Candidatus Baltobacteraceae bacterium]|nr:helix-turn-helix transcriptional regulator [Candidatus Baltobacteraceae bacterium]